MQLFDTQRLTIRHITLSDKASLTPLLTDKKTMQYSIKQSFTDSEVDSFIIQMINTYAEAHFGYWLVIEKETEKAIGLCGLNRHQVDGLNILHLNYRLGSDFLGRGYATEIALGLKNYSANVLNEQTIYAMIFPSNIESIAVVKRANFEFLKQTEFKGNLVNLYKNTLAS
ncbi:GNAT family N-acetyltransferase [Pseudoalteromonas sp. G4]|uniref:GNAT family N-acetyltransferase n=1 Tax=Pseudoalteromonas sp. G4 TaxID=2992761 RepID=UPI00237EB2E9|nr:GNAT family N-acetyltransferase [Pseudoalteromonas sp. G4]MDE3273341.1 GNAT family N-acetyltransferase [Pseudoalteromonas sp. G4]